MAPTSKHDTGGDIEVVRTLASLGSSSLEQVRPSIEKDEGNTSAHPSNLIDIINNDLPNTVSSRPKLIIAEQPKLDLRTRLVLAKSISPKKSSIKMANIAFEGVDLTSEAGQVNAINWHDPHPLFVIILVGPEETPFGIQKDLLSAKCPYYRKEFLDQLPKDVEQIVKLPNTSQAAFGCFQNFIFTGKVYEKDLGQEIPDYGLLLDVWKLATQLQIPPLRMAVLNAMADRRMATSRIPGTSFLIQAWKETEEGSGLRLMLIGWAADHMRGNPDQRNHFARSLPQAILSELVIVMSELPSNPSFIPSAVKHTLPVENPDAEPARPPIKRARKSAADAVMTGPDADFDTKPTIKKPARKSEPSRRVSRRASNQVFQTAEEDTDFTPEKEMEYCRGLIDRMIQGPGFWTRLVGPFKFPVNPETDNVPNYFDVVKRPMDLNTIKTKINSGMYTNGAEFEADVRLIFQNCYEYWTQEDGMWDTCVSFEKYFDEQWGSRHRWSGGKKIKTEIIDG